MFWNEICDMADGAACGDSFLMAKDEARSQVREFVTTIGCPDPDMDEIPENTIGRYCDKMSIRFDERGNIIELKLPDWVERIICLREKTENSCMTVKECVKKNGWQVECDVSKHKNYKDCRMTVDIGFINSEDKDDEVEFDVTLYDVEELEALFIDFCKENQFPNNTVTYVTIVAITAIVASYCGSDAD